MRRFFPWAMASSPMATVKELETSTKVLTPPSQVSRPARGLREGVGVEEAVDAVGGEEGGEEQDLGGQEEPHAEPLGLALLLEALEVVGDGAMHDAPPAPGARPRPAARGTRAARARRPARSSKFSSGGGDGVSHS